MKRLLLMVGVILALAGLGIKPSASQVEGSDSDAPFLYYFSVDQQAFVIEGADGSEGRVLGDGIIPTSPDTLNTIDDSSWSASGEWFAWVESVHPMEAFNSISQNQNAAIIRSDGSESLPVFENYDAIAMQWSPVDDVLFVIIDNFERSDNGRGPYTTEHDVEFLLIDVSQGLVQSIWQSHEVYETAEYYVTWTPDGDIIVTASSTLDHGWLIDSQGDVSLFSTENSIPSVFPDLFAYHEMVLSPSSNRLYLEDDQLWVESVIDQSRQSFDRVPVEYAIWTNDGEYALLVGDVGVWLLSLPDNEIHPIDESMSLQLPRLIANPAIWSTDGDHAILPTHDDGVFHFDCAANSLQKLDVHRPQSYNDFFWDWLSDDRIAITGGLDTASGEAIIGFYDLTSGDGHTIDLLETMHWVTDGFYSFPYFGAQFDVTSDGRRLAFIHEGPMLVDIEDGTVIIARPDYDSFFAGFGGEIYWHEDEDWLLVHEEGLVAGGGYIRHNGVLSADGQIRRDLGQHVRWLPSQVNAQNLPPVSPTPIFPQPDRLLRDNQWNFYASWSPDGEQIAVGLDRWFGGETPIHLWDLETETVETVFEDVPSSQAIAWEEIADGDYVPSLIPESRIDGYEEYVRQAISPDGGYAVIADASDFVSVYAYDGTVIGDLAAEIRTDGNSITSIAYSPDGRFVAIGGPWKRVEIWETDTWTQVARLPNPGAGLAFSPDGKTLVVTISWDIQLWDVEMLVGE